jgi:hypothetical protein
MRIKTRMVSGGYMDVSIEVRSTSIDLGLLDEEGRRELAKELEDAIDDLLSGIK